MSELDIGIASWGSPQKLRKTVDYIERNTVSDYRLFIVDNASPDPKVAAAIEEMAAKNNRIVPVMLEENTGYPGAVNEFIRRAETTFVAYFDNDAYVSTSGWDKKMMDKIGSFHELAMVFPNGGNYPIPRTHYTEVLWGVGFCWMLNRQRWIDVGPFDEEIGHQEEVDFQTRLRLDGWKIAALSDVHVKHDATSSTNPESAARINQGVVNWVNKWVAYFGGKHMNYHSPNVIRFADWPVNALYLEEYYLQKFPNLNQEPEQVTVDGQPMDLIKVPRYQHLYRGRVI